MTKESQNHELSPRFFRDILGQERVLGYLKAALSRGRLAHAYLFLGPEGVGKESVARALAAALNCADLKEDGDGCGVGRRWRWCVNLPFLQTPGRGHTPGLPGH